jgi:hypothetical protein
VVNVIFVRSASVPYGVVREDEANNFAVGGPGALEHRVAAGIILLFYFVALVRGE